MFLNSRYFGFIHGFFLHMKPNDFHFPTIRPHRVKGKYRNEILKIVLLRKYEPIYGSWLGLWAVDRSRG